jgi:hypothetical protein
MNKHKFLSLSIAGALALGSAYAFANDAQKQAELANSISIGNPNAPARGEAIAKSAQMPGATLSGVQSHEEALDRAIAVGNPNAPARGEAIAASAAATVAQPRQLDANVHEQELDAMISAGNPNAPVRGMAIAQSGRAHRA